MSADRDDHFEYHSTDLDLLGEREPEVYGTA